MSNNMYQQPPNFQMPPGMMPPGMMPPGMGGPAGGNEEGGGIQMSDIIDSLREGMWLILACFLVIGIGSAVWASAMPATYQATAQTEIEPPLGSLGGTVNFMALAMQMEGTILTELAKLKYSTEVAERIAKRLVDQAEIQPEIRRFSILQSKPPPTAMEEIVMRTKEMFGMKVNRGSGENLIDQLGKAGAVLAVAQKLKIGRGYLMARRGSREIPLILLVGTSTQPDETAYLANLLAEEFKKWSREQESQDLVATKEFMISQQNRYNQNLLAAQAELASFKQSHNTVALKQETSQAIGEQSSLQVAIEEAGINLRKQEAELRLLETQLNEIRPQLVNALASNSTSERKALQAQLSQLETGFRDLFARNPSLKADGSNLAGRQLEDWNRKVKLTADVRRLAEDEVQELIRTSGVTDIEGITRIQTLGDQINNRKIVIDGLKAQMGLTRSRIADYDVELNRIPVLENDLANLAREVAKNDGLLANMSTQLAGIELEQARTQGKVKITQKAIAPDKNRPVAPDKNRIMALGMMMGLLLGIGIAAGRRVMDKRLRTPDDIKRLGYTILGIIPDMARSIRADFDGKEKVVWEGRAISTRLMTLLMPTSPVSEAYRGLRTNIQFSRPDAVTQVMLVTSSTPGEGKSVTAMNLSITMMQAGRRVLHIDADMRRPTASKLLGSATGLPGLSEILTGMHRFDTEEYATGIEGLYFVPTGGIPPNPAELIGSKNMARLLEKARKEFDIIVIDSPPILAVTDSVLLSKQGDAVILVTSSGTTESTTLTQTVGVLNRVSAPIIGIVLNRFEPKANGPYGSYGYGYNGYYREENDEEPARV